MGYACSQAALRTLQAIKQVLGANEPESNVIKLQKRLNASCVDSPKRVMFERGREQADGAITGRLVWLEKPGALYGKASRDVAPFRINADGSIAKFPCLGGVQHMKIGQLARDPNFLEAYFAAPERFNKIASDLLEKHKNVSRDATSASIDAHREAHAEILVEKAELLNLNAKLIAALANLLEAADAGSWKERRKDEARAVLAESERAAIKRIVKDRAAAVSAPDLGGKS